MARPKHGRFKTFLGKADDQRPTAPPVINKASGVVGAARFAQSVYASHSHENGPKAWRRSVRGSDAASALAFLTLMSIIPRRHKGKDECRRDT